MQKVKLGNSNVEVSAIGVGTWAWGDTLFWKYGSDYGEVEVKKAFSASLDAGVTLFDTAEVYGLGKSEELLGQFMKAIAPRVPRSQIKIATKYMPVPWRLGKQAVKDAVAKSLERLQVESIDLYQIHQPFTFLMGQETLLNALADEVKAGRIKALGVSNFSADQMRKAHETLAKRKIPLTVNQVQYSLIAKKVETNGTLDAAEELGVTILAYSPLAQGVLSGKYTSTNPPKGARQLDPKFGSDGITKVQPLLRVLADLAEVYDATMAQVAINWLAAQQNVIPIPGAKNAKQAQENAAALEFKLVPEEITQLDRVSDECTR
ncbi:NADP-dependent oxidoreductase domain protein [Thalassoporum mexicanum PCC 7367]|uniref:aldo/keto reductase n=1 Tax=Thalassoporum mexicanum TaxID=3457544 RepID=UPI00029F9C44|nr:aldo/keto reductase [Pseudanabaena sp. PCC 7367]AFY70708.1 NADP-dependent oxidoreductase domain protein [Pseudanabaena sp. PCC 7367]